MAKSQPKTPSFESAVAELEEIVRLMETGELGLEQALAQYQRGMTLARHCRSALDSAEQRIQELHDGELSELASPPSSDA